MLQRVDFNPYGYLHAPLLDGIPAMVPQKVQPISEKETSFRRTLENAYGQYHRVGTEETGYQYVPVENSGQDYGILRYAKVGTEENGYKYIPIANTVPQHEPICLDVPFDQLMVNVLYDPNEPNGLLKAAMSVKLGHNFAVQFFNFDNFYDKLAELKFQADNTDDSGMSNADKYARIFDRYAQAFGSDFLKSTAISYVGNGQPHVETVLKAFRNELQAAIGDSDNIMKARRTALYGDMSDSEIQERIAANYPAMDNITLREFYYMVWEMKSVGVDGNLSNVLNRATGVNALVREELLDQPLDVEQLCNTYNSMNNAMLKTFHNDVGTSGEILRKLLGTSPEGYENSSWSALIRVSFDTLVTQISQKYDSWTGKDYEKWLESQAVVF